MTAIENKGGLKKEKVYKREIKEKDVRNRQEQTGIDRNRQK